MNCTTCRLLAMDLALGALDAATAETVRAHLDTCAACRAATQAFATTTQLLQRALAAPAPQLPTRLAPARRQAVWAALADANTNVRSPAAPARQWFLRRHPRLMMAAALMLMVGFFAALLLPATSRARKSSQMTQTVNNGRNLFTLLYAEDMDAFSSGVGSPLPASESEPQPVVTASPAAPAASGSVENEVRDQTLDAPRPSAPRAKVEKDKIERQLAAGAGGVARLRQNGHADEKKDAGEPSVPKEEFSPVVLRGQLGNRGSRMDDNRREAGADEPAKAMGGESTWRDDGSKLLGETLVLELREADSLDEVSQSAKPAPAGPAVGVNPILIAREHPLSTFAIDVDTAAYTLARNHMLAGFLPPPESVRTEEFVNFFDYLYPPPTHGAFAVHTTVAPSPFGRGLHLMKIGVKGRRLGREEQRPAVLTLLVDTSGSMDTPDRIGLVRTALRLLIGALGPRDVVSLVQYDSQARLVLDRVPAERRAQMLAAIDALQCSGSTNLEEGLRKAYGLAANQFMPGAENRVLLLSDGVATLGSDSADDLLRAVADFRNQGIYASVFGFGSGNYNDTMLETLANKGDGAYVFIDSEAEARRVFVEDLGATLNTIASDVKIQVQFDPARVRSYRQLGYENRQLTAEQFRDDAVDAGEVGSGQSVTALYELELSLAPADASPHADDTTRLATVRVRYRDTARGAVQEIEQPVPVASLLRDARTAPPQFRLAACAAEFAEILRGSPHAAGADYDAVASWLRPVALERRLDAQVAELLQLVERAPGLSRRDAPEPTSEP